MKKLFFTLLTNVILISVYGQAPQEISYQGVARNSTGTLLANQNIGIKLDLHQGSSTGTVVFSETHNKTTNGFGLFTLGIGSVNSASFTGINWANGPYFLEVSIDPAGGTSYSSVGTQQFMSVPYALYAQTSGNSSPTPTITINTPNTVTSSAGSYTINVPAAISYSAGTGIAITGGVISNTAIATTPTIIGTGATTVTSSGNTFTVNSPIPNVYSAGTGIDITGGVISNTAAVSNPTINSGGVANVTNPSTNVYLVDVPAPTINYNSGTNELTLTQNGATSTATLNGTGTNTISIIGNGLASVTPTTGSSFTVSVPNPTLALISNSLSISNGNTVVLPTPTLQTLSINSNSLSISGGNTVTIPTSSVVSTNTNITVSSSAGIYSLTAVTPTLNVVGGAITGSYPSQTLTIPTSSTTVLTQSTGVVVTGTAPNYTLSSPNQSLTINSNSLSITGGNTVVVPTSSVVAGNSNITVTPSGNTYSVSAASYSLTSNSNTLTLSNGSSITTATVPTTSITGTGTGIATATTSANSFTVNVPTPTYTAATGVLAFGSNTIGISPTLSLIGTTLQSGASTNTVNLSSINNWSVTSGVIFPSTLTNSVGIGTSGPITGKFEILHTATTSNPHVNIVSPAGSYGRIKFSNTGQGSYFTTEAYNDGSGNNEAYSISQFNGTNAKQVFLINGQRMAYINALNYPLAAFHVMTSTATAPGGIASEGFAQAGQVNIVRNNNAGAGARSAVISGDEIGKVNFAGFDGSAFGDGAKIYAKATENVTGSNKGTELYFAAVPTGTNTNKDAFKINGLGNLEVISGLRVPFGATAGYVLTSDASGLASWQASSYQPFLYNSGVIYPTNPSTDKLALGYNGFGATSLLNIQNLGVSGVNTAPIASIINYNSAFTNTMLTLSSSTGAGDLMYAIGTTSVTNGVTMELSNGLNVKDVLTLKQGSSNGNVLKLSNNNQPSYEWLFNVDGSSNMILKNEGNGTPLNIMAFNPNNGNVGVGTASPINKFHVNGSVAITDGTQGVGKVLVSDASGNASWMPIMKITYGSASCQSVASVSTTPVKFNTNLGSVVKSYSDTHLEVILQTDLNVFDLVGSNAVTYEVKVNGTSANGNTGKAVYFVDNANAFNTFNNKGVTITAEFDGLTTGTYNVELWVYCASGSALNVYIDPGCFGASSVIIKEFK